MLVQAHPAGIHLVGAGSRENTDEINKHPDEQQRDRKEIHEGNQPGEEQQQLEHGASVVAKIEIVAPEFTEEEAQYDSLFTAINVPSVRPKKQ